MPELDPRNNATAAAEHVDQEDEEDLAEAYEALDEHRRQQAALTQGQPPEHQPAPHETEGVGTSGDGARDQQAPAEPTRPPADSAAPARSTAAAAPSRRVFLIDGKGASC